MTRLNTFQPNWVSVPGDTIRDVLRDKKWTVPSFAERMECSSEYIEALITGQESITREIAKKLSDTLGSTPSFWLTREAQYREDSTRIAKKKQETAEKEWLKCLPFGDMVSFGWIPPVTDFKDKLKSCLDFFQVPNIETWRNRYCDMITHAAFRTSPTFTPRMESVAAWLRQGEIRASQIRCKSWNPELFKKKLQEIRRLTRRRNPSEFIPELIKICSECGVAIAIIRTPTGCQASGATRFVSPNRALMQLSFRYLSDDQFWFSFFHEAGHLLLHSPNAVFLEETRKERTITKEENEANEFASNLLIPSKMRSLLRKMPINKKSILKFAIVAGISRGIVVGQLQHMGRIDYTRYNGYKHRFNWKEIEQ